MDNFWNPQEYRQNLIRVMIKLLTEKPETLHTVNVENAYAELIVNRDEEGNVIEDDFLEM
ncbi:hypothetical protein PCC9214_05356 [Planktothrix tepida]|uniref:Uncharacterized protein n=1 Tax=Planktothrix tepida PCC 9214 TaxID=671072 RepID=A0A1J1LHP9_9CYAN|nr:hypothetical protein [Planktothrix tepida]CAD5984926.1 hypothetical protein PCC9214_05318 [Planktothrix tepida]CAD5985198.1 hypothetical protein PCC9214_05356 [Planktothrix tepida]CUR32133.1 hypothetical protein PL9214430105 [Planktothrix tepida PCC 9214]